MHLLSDGVVFGELGDDGSETKSGVESAGGVCQHFSNELLYRRRPEEKRAQKCNGENRKRSVECGPAGDDPQRG